MKSPAAQELRIPEKWPVFCEEAARTLRENQTLVDTFFQFHKILRLAGIETIPLKGMELLLRAYPSFALRPMADCDLLIQKKDIFSVMRILEAHGLQRKPDEGLTYLSKDKGINFDILWDIWYVKDMAELWKRSAVQTEKGLPLRFLHPEDSLIYLVTYVTAHRGVLSPLLAQDLQYFLSSQGAHLDWGRCIEQVNALKIKIPFRHGLLYALREGCDQIPEDILPRLLPANSRERRLARLYERLVTEEGHPPVSYFFTWLGYPGLSGKLKLLREKFLPAKWEADIHWGPHSPLHYFAKILLRPFHLILRAMKILSVDSLFLFRRLKK